MKNIERILLELVGIQSDTGTILECRIADKIYEMIKRHGYFEKNPENFGTYEKNDVLKRPIVWALRRGKTDKTVILMGHYDAVEIETYGALKPYALTPSLLKEELKKMKIEDRDLIRDLEDDNWAFGRGIADMKAGVAINIHTLFTNDNEDINILFIAVPDEENMSSGALQSIYLLKDLQKKFGLKFMLSIITEPQFRNIDEDYQLIEGSMGKFLPMVLAKGVLTHGAQIFNGLNSGFIISEIIRNIELKTDMTSEDNGTFTHPPTVQVFKDLKTTYDVSVPEYSVACFNFLFLKNKAPSSIIKDIKTICESSLDYVIDRYNKAFDIMKDKGLVEEYERKHFKRDVMTLSDLEDYVRKNNKDFSLYKKQIDKILEDKINSNEMKINNASMYYMKSLLEISGIDYPVVIIGVSPPYYPAVTNKVLDKDINYALEGISEYTTKEYKIGSKIEPYFQGMCDMSYMSSTNPREEREFLDNLTLPRSVYDVPVEEISELNIPSLLLGPASKDIHKRGERVYMPDVTKRIPKIIEKIIENL